MAYVNGNPKSKAELKRWLVEEGRTVTTFQPGPFAAGHPVNGTVSLEGPHYPKPHRWWAQGVLVDGKLTGVK